MTSAIAPILEAAPSMPADAVVRQAIAVLGSGGVVAFPTDTLYGVWVHSSGFALSLVFLAFAGSWGLPIAAGIIAG